MKAQTCKKNFFLLFVSPFSCVVVGQCPRATDGTRKARDGRGPDTAGAGKRGCRLVHRTVWCLFVSGCLFTLLTLLICNCQCNTTFRFSVVLLAPSSLVQANLDAAFRGMAAGLAAMAIAGVAYVVFGPAAITSLPADNPDLLKSVFYGGEPWLIVCHNTTGFLTQSIINGSLAQLITLFCSFSLFL
jgi:hypothetical protein